MCPPRTLLLTAVSSLSAARVPSLAVPSPECAGPLPALRARTHALTRRREDVVASLTALRAAVHTAAQSSTAAADRAATLAAQLQSTCARERV